MLGSSLFSLALAGLAGLAASAPVKQSPTTPRSIDCLLLPLGMSAEDCDYFSSIGMAGMGDNVDYNNGYIWLGEDGPNTFTFTNRAGNASAITLVLWDNPPNDYESSFMNVRTPKISYTLPSDGDSVTVSLENDISGGFSAIVASLGTALSVNGQMDNTWGEFTTGAYATVDVSREVKMSGSEVSIVVEDTGCLSDMDTCSFQCKDGAETCWESGTYDLVNCDPSTNPGASYGTYDGINPEGGCTGFPSGGHLDIDLGL